MKIHRFIYSLILITVILHPLLFISCTDENEFNVGEDFIESQTGINLVDTFTVKLSTVMLDSLASSAIDTLLIGNFRDNVFGKVTSSSYFEIGLPDDRDVENTDFYDSITISLWYTGYSYGDTLSPMRISVYRLNEEIDPGDRSSYLYNTSSFSYDEIPLGTYTFEPRPSKDSIEFSLNDELGQLFFDMMSGPNDPINNDAEFLNFFKGLVIIPDTNYNSSVIGFDAKPEHLKIKLYTHRIETELEEIQYEFSIINPEQQFNQIQHDFRNSSLSPYIFSGTAMPSSQMDDKSFTQGGIGLMTKIEFPSMNEFLLYENSRILKAELIMKPAKMSYNTFELPEEIYLYNTDEKNDLGTILYNSTGNALEPVFTYDELFFDQTSYRWDITNFIIDELSDNYFDTDHGLMITFSYEEYLCSLKRVVFEALDDAAMLKIYYVTY